MPEHLVGSPVTCGRDSWRSKYKQHCWVEYDSTGGVRQLTKCPLARALTLHMISHVKIRSLNNMNINDNNNNNRIFSLNILCVIQVKVSAWPQVLGPSSKHRLQLTLEETSPAVFFLFSHAQIMLGRKLGNIPHCQTSWDSICPWWGPHRLQNSGLGQLVDTIMIRATSGA